MAVPKKKKSSSRSSMRRGSNGTFEADFPNVIVDKSSGDLNYLIIFLQMELTTVSK